MNIFTSMWSAVVKAWGDLIKNSDGIITSIVQIVLIITAARLLRLIVTGIIKKAVRLRAQKSPDSLTGKKQDTLSSLLQNTCKYLILFLEVTAILSALGLGTTVTSLLTTAGIGGLAIGLGAQSLIGDTVNGFFILIDDEFAVGDYVKIGDFTGTVQSITLRTTRIRQVNNEIVTIPNGKIGAVVNYTRDCYELFSDMDVSIEEDTAKAGRIMLETAKRYAKEHDFIVSEPTFAGAVEMNSMYQRLRICIKLKPLDQWRAERDLRAEYLREFKKNGIKLPSVSQAAVIKE